VCESTAITNFTSKKGKVIFVTRFYYSKLFLVLLLLMAASSCTKKPAAVWQASPEKKMNFFVIEAYKNLGLYGDAIGRISNDTVHFTLSDGFPLFYVFPTIQYSGKHLEPAENIAQNFSKPVRYTVTAEDGTTKQYIVVGTSILNHTSKDILLFSFRTSNNPFLPSDINGTIRNDSVFVKLPSSMDLHELTPYIFINGISISPDNLVRQDFSKPVNYKVTAEDASFKNYLVVVSN